MDQNSENKAESKFQEAELRSIIRDAIQEFVRGEQSKAEPALKAELVEERKRREQLERKMNELTQESRKAQQRAAEAEKEAGVRMELQRLGVAKVDLAFRAVRDEVLRLEDGRLVAKGPGGEVPLKEYLREFVQENPELMPARIPGGTGAAAQRPLEGSAFDLDKIRPGMTAEEREAARREIARIASQSLRDA